MFRSRNVVFVVLLSKLRQVKEVSAVQSKLENDSAGKLRELSSVAKCERDKTALSCKTTKSVQGCHSELCNCVIYKNTIHE